VELALRTIQSEGSRGSYRETQGSQEYQFCEAALYLTIRTRVTPAIDIQCVLEKLESDAKFHTHQFFGMVDPPEHWILKIAKGN